MLQVLPGSRAGRNRFNRRHRTLGI